MVCSCNDFLEREPLSFKSEEAYFHTAEDFKLSVNDLYQYLPQNNSIWGGTYTEDCKSDNQCSAGYYAIFLNNGDYKTQAQSNSGNIWNFDRLRKHVDAKLGIPELLTVRRNARRAKKAARERRWLAKQKPIHCQSVVLGDYTVNATPPRLDATMRAFARFLQEKDLPPKLAVHRDRFLRWLSDAANT